MKNLRQFCVLLFVMVVLAATNANADGNAPAANPNLLTNADWRQLEEGAIVGWMPYGQGATLAPGQGREGRAAITAQRTGGEATHGLGQVITLAQTKPKALVLSAWSKAENVSDTPTTSYSLYADVAYADGTNQYGLNTPFATGTHDWQRAELSIVPDKPIKSVTLFLIFRDHTGKVWFSEPSLSEK